MNLYATCCESAASSLAVSQYPPIAPNRNQVVKLLPQRGHLVGRAQIMPGGTPNQIHKAKQPQQILPKPIPPNTSPQRQSVPRLNTAMPQQNPILINQPQTQSPALLLNQVLTSGAPVIVQPAGPGGTVHLMLRTPTPTLQSGPGPPQNKMIIANTTQPQPQATVLIQNRQQVIRFMTTQGPMQLQQIQTPSGPQLIAIPQNQSLSFPTNSVLVQSPAANTLQLQQNSGNALQLRQSPSAIIQPGSFSQSSLPNQISLQNQIFHASTGTSTPAAIKRDDKTSVIDNTICLSGANEQKKIVIDNKINFKKNINIVSSNNFNNGNGIISGSFNAANSLNSSNIKSNININSSAKKNTKTGKGKADEDASSKNLNKNFGNLMSSPVSMPTTVAATTTTAGTAAQKNITSSLRQIRPGNIANRNKQNQNVEAKEKTDETNSKSLSNLTRIIDSVASNTEHLISPSPKVDSKIDIKIDNKVENKIDNLTATINSVAENVKSPTPDDIMSNLSFNDVFMPGNKTLTLNKRPNLTIVQKQSKPEAEEQLNRLILSPNSNLAVDFESMSDNYDSLELSGITISAGVQTTEAQGYVPDQNNSSNQGIFPSPDDSKKGKKKVCGKKKGKKEENRVDLWDLMKSAGIGDDEFDEPTGMNAFPQDTTTITEPLEVSAADTELLAQLQSASQMPAGIRVVIGENGRPDIINGSNVLIPETLQSSSGATTTSTTESTDPEAVLQNMILPDNVFSFTPQAFATAQTQLNQLIQDHGGLTTSSSDQQLLSQIFGTTATSISNSTASVTTNNSTPIIHASPPSAVPVAQDSNLPSSSTENVMISVPSNSEGSQSNLAQKQEPKPEYIGGPPPGLPPLGPDSLVITNNNGVPTLVASPALMQYLQTHPGIIQFHHDPITKTIQPSLIIPHPQHKIEPTPAVPQDNRMDKSIASLPNNIRSNISQNQEAAIIKTRPELKASIGTTTDDQKNNLNNGFNLVGSNSLNPNIVKLNMVKFVKDNPSLLQIATETNNLINYKERNKTLSDKDLVEIDKKIQQNRSILDQCLLMENSQGQVTVQNVIVKEGSDKDAVTYQVGTADKLSAMSNKTTETQTLEDLQNLDMTLIKGFHPPPKTNSPTPTSDFQAKFLESIGMSNKTPAKATVSIGTGTSSNSLPTNSATATAASTKRGRKKKEKIQNQATQADVKTETPCLTFNIAELTPEQNVRLNQALQSRGPIVNQIENLEAIKQIIHEEVRKITCTPTESASIRFTNSSNAPTDDHDITDSGITTANVVLSSPNLNQLLDQQHNQGSVISLQGNELVAINNGSQQIFTSQNQVLSGNHFVSSNNQILAIGGNHNQLVSLGNPINSSNQIVTLGSPPNMMSVSGNNVASPGAVLVGSNGNVVAIVHQNAPPGTNPGIVQRIQTIQLTAPKQQHFKTIQNQIQTLSAKPNRTPTEQSTLQKLILEQQKILSTGKLVPTLSGQPVQGMQIVSQTNPSRLYQAQPTSQHQQNQLSQSITHAQQNIQTIQQQQPQACNISNATSISQSSKSKIIAQVSCGTSTSDFNASFQSNIPKMSVPPTVLISDVPTSNYGPLYVSPNTSGKNVTKCEKGTSPIQIQMGTQTVTNMEYRSGKMSTGTMTSPNTGKPQAVVAPAIVIQQTESQSSTCQMKQRNQAIVNEPMRAQVPALSRTAVIEQQMRTDQAGATMPDTKTPFLSKSDACKRLIRYHVMDEKALSLQDLATADDIFEATAQHLLDKFRAMKEKYKYLLMLESMREVSTAERIMVDRNFIIEERMELEELREKEKRLQEEFENPTLLYPNTTDSTFVKTEFMLDEVKTEINDLIGSEGIKSEYIDDDKETVISKSINSSDINSDNPFKLTEANRNIDLTRIKSETKECKNTRTSNRSRSESPNEEESYSISSKCKAKSSRTLSDGSSKSSLDGSKDEDSGTDINAQVQSAIDSILNLQKCETMSDATEDSSALTKRTKMKRKFGHKLSENSKRLKMKSLDGGKKEKNFSEDSEDDDDESEVSDADPILDEAIRSILTS